MIELGAARSGREADLRFGLVRVSEATDGIALYGGEQDERKHLDRELNQVIAIMRQNVSGLVRLTWLTAGYGWFAIVAPILIAAPGYFNGQLTFGELMMTVGAFNQVQQALRWVVDNASGIADWRAALLRVMSFRQALLSMDHMQRPSSQIDVVENSKSLAFDHVTVSAADREISLDKPMVEIGPSERVLIIGKPGSGKSMFFRAIAGLWLRGSGKLHLPPRTKMMFLPQRPYIATGSLRNVLTYPSASANFSKTDLIRALERTNLSYLIPSLDRVARWDKDLTNHEQQHLYFARLLIHKPRWIISDEVICHLNEDDRKIMSSLLEQELANAAVISITSNDAQRIFYSRAFHLISRAIPNGDVPSIAAVPVPSSARFRRIGRRNRSTP